MYSVHWGINQPHIHNFHNLLCTLLKSYPHIKGRMCAVYSHFFPFPIFSPSFLELEVVFRELMKAWHLLPIILHSWYSLFPVHRHSNFDIPLWEKLLIHIQNLCILLSVFSGARGVDFILMAIPIHCRPWCGCDWSIIVFGLWSLFFFFFFFFYPRH